MLVRNHSPFVIQARVKVARFCKDSCNEALIEENLLSLQPMVDLQFFYNKANSARRLMKFAPETLNEKREHYT